MKHQMQSIEHSAWHVGENTSHLPFSILTCSVVLNMLREWKAEALGPGLLTITSERRTVLPFSWAQSSVCGTLNCYSLLSDMCNQIFISAICFQEPQGSALSPAVKKSKAEQRHLLVQMGSRFPSCSVALVTRELRAQSHPYQEVQRAMVAREQGA